MDPVSDIRRTIDETLSAEGVCVFPSEVTVSFWRGDTARRRAADRTGEKCAALPADRFISWDTFKERTTRSEAARKPVNRRIRALFVHACLTENRKKAWLQRIVPPEHADHSLRFAPVITRGLPGLPALVSAPGFAGLNARLKHDLVELIGRYEHFMDTCGLFEPAWAPAGVRTGGTRYVVFFPELLEDWPEFSGAVTASDDVDVLQCFTGQVEPDSVEVVEYQDTLVEIRAVLDQVEAVIGSGSAVDRIVLTVADLEASRDELEREARRRGLSLGMRAGRSLSDHAAGSIFVGIAEVVERRFAVDACTRLFRMPTIPWFEPEAMRLLSRFGVEHGCLSTQRFDAWKAAFDGGGSRRFRETAEDAGWPAGELARLFDSVRTGLEAIVHSPSFTEIRKNLYARLIGSLVDPDGFGPEIEPVFQRCLTVLGEWIDAERQTGLCVDKPFAVFLASLADVVYVRPADKTGVAVYPYRVSAGMLPDHHFVIGLGRRAIASPLAVSPFLQVHERDQIGLPDHDLTESFLRAYAWSGRDVRLSYSAQTPGGVSLAPPVTVVEAPAEGAGLYGHEVACWGGQAAAPETGWYEPQSAGFGAWQARPRVAGPDYRRQPVEPGSRAAAVLASLLADDNEQIRVSAGAVDALRAQPFGAMLAHYVGIDTAYSQMQGSDPLTFGSLEHEAVEWVHRQIREAGCTALGRWNDYVSEEALEEHVRSYIRGRALKESPVPQVFLQLLVPKFVRAVMHALQTEATLLPDAMPYEYERSLSMRISDRVQVRGRVDALHASGPGGFALIDYKKNSIPQNNEIKRGERTQIPLYRLMFEAQGQSISEAHYVSFENTRNPKRTVFGGEKAVIGETEWPDYRASLEAGLEYLADTMIRLDFHCPGGARGCDGCPTREICRGKFAHRASNTGDES